ncbi:VOC family protein [Alicyclobacillus acidiphilus]|uniref:VOC family protein n=1 Tax=Alicyclobacillus acidiphilus TaxID=182455 RepID=UPI0009FB15C9|nr:VOC family protein [Alicyclobacillus acidiphilus]
MVGITKLGQVSITVRDLSRAVAFYRDVLELQYIWETNGMAFFQCGEVRLMLSLPENSEFDHPSSVLYYNVEDINETYNDLRSRGVEFKGKPHEIGKLGDNTIMMAFFSDTEGNVVAIQSETPTTK